MSDPTRISLKVIPGSSRDDVAGWLEEIAQPDSIVIAASNPLIELTNAQLEWSDQPTFVFFEQFERWTSIEIEGADVTTLLDLTLFVLEDDSKRQSLGSADIGPVFIDTAGALIIQKRTSTDRMRFPVPQEICMRTTNPFGLDSGYREIVQTTFGTSPPTLQTIGVDHRERIRLAVDLRV